MNQIKKILIAPLDWGLGHTTRCIPIIRELLKQGFEVIIAGHETTQKVLQEEFPELTYVYLKGYEIRYAKVASSLPWVMVKQIPKIIGHILREHIWLKQVIKQYQIDAVISDNRYGLYSKKIFSIFITHQLHIQVPQSKWAERVILHINRFFIKRYNQCWVPDTPHQDLGGLLTQPISGLPIQYIGLLSRFNMPQDVIETLYDYLFILSGPEPQRSLLEHKILQECEHLQGRKCLVRGLPSTDNNLTSSSFEIIPYAGASQLEQLMLSSNQIICRSGYSSIMDLVKLNKSALLIPTPGQTEQIYLGQYLQSKRWFSSISQDSNITEALKDNNHQTDLSTFLYQAHLLALAISQLKGQL